MALASPIENVAPSLLTVHDLLPLSAESLDRFDAALPTGAIPDSLLVETSGRDLVDGLSRVVAALKEMDLAAVSKTPSWWSRLTGADLEDRVLLRQAVSRVSADFQDAMKAATKASGAIKTMATVGRSLQSEQVALEALIQAGRAALYHSADGDCELVPRFEQKLANAMALHVSNNLTISQLRLTITHIRGILDQAAEVKNLLFPVWRQHALALASQCSPDERKGAAAALREAHQQMATRLSPNTISETL